MEKYKKLKEKINVLDEQIRPLEREKYEINKELRIVTETLEEVVKSEQRNKEFIEKCNEFDPEDIFVDLEENDDRFEYGTDDGTLHISQGKIHACFISNQDLSKKEFKEQSTPIINAFSIKWEDIT